MKLTLLHQWKYDEGGEIIQSPEAGRLEWLARELDSTSDIMDILP